MIYFTSDLHLGHQSVINMCQRPFDTGDEMNKTMIHNWNDLVTNNDTIYILGNLCYRIKNDEANSIIKKLKGKKILILGNHDHKYGMYDESLCQLLLTEVRSLQWGKPQLQTYQSTARLASIPAGIKV